MADLRALSDPSDIKIVRVGCSVFYRLRFEVPYMIVLFAAGGVDSTGARVTVFALLSFLLKNLFYKDT